MESQTCVEEIFARIFIIFAGTFWITLSITSELWYFIFGTIMFTAVTMYLSYTSKKLAAGALLLGGFFPILWGAFVLHWEIGVWEILSAFFFIPTLASAYLLWKKCS